MKVHDVLSSQNIKEVQNKTFFLNIINHGMKISFKIHHDFMYHKESKS